MNYYDEKYFQWQNSIGRFGGWANKFKFEAYIKDTDYLLDFGSAGGWLLKSLTAQNKIGIEINDTAREFSLKHNQIISKKNIDELEDNSIDTIISNHALEHVENPLEAITKLRSKLKGDGVAIFIVPCESIKNKYNPDDINMHLYTWNPQTLGNLFRQAGYKVISCKPLYHKWPPKYKFWAKFGFKFFNVMCLAYGYFSRNVSQVKIIAKNENPSL